MAVPGSQAPTVTNIQVTLRADEDLGIIGPSDVGNWPSGVGKMSLVRVLVGIWRPARSAVRINGATMASGTRPSLVDTSGSCRSAPNCSRHRLREYRLQARDPAMQKIRSQVSRTFWPVASLRALGP